MNESDMLFKALSRVKELGPETANKVFDRQLERWWEQYRNGLSPEELAEVEYHETMNEILPKRPPRDEEDQPVRCVGEVVRWLAEDGDTSLVTIRVDDEDIRTGIIPWLRQHCWIIPME